MLKWYKINPHQGGFPMTYTAQYASPLGPITLACDESAVIGLWFGGQKYFGSTLPAHTEAKEHSLLREAMRWLDIYFYGETMTYGQIARELARRQGRDKVSAQAVGGAVGHNPISLLIPCHRVVGTGGSLTGYAGGLDRKVQLLRLEGADMSHLFIPKKGTAL